MSSWNLMKKYQPYQPRIELLLGMILSAVSRTLCGWVLNWPLTLKIRSALDFLNLFRLGQKRDRFLVWKLKIPNLCGLLKQPQSIVGGECLFNSSCYVYENNRLESYCEQEGQCSVDLANQERVAFYDSFAMNHRLWVLNNPESSLFVTVRRRMLEFLANLNSQKPFLRLNHLHGLAMIFRIPTFQLLINVSWCSVSAFERQRHELFCSLLVIKV